MAKKKMGQSQVTPGQVKQLRTRLAAIERQLRICESGYAAGQRGLDDLRSAQRELAQSMVRLCNQLDDLSRRLPVVEPVTAVSEG